MRTSVSTRLMVALVATLSFALAVATQAAPAADEVGPDQAPGNPARLALVHAAPFNPDGGSYARSDTAVTVTASRGGERAVLESGFIFGETVSYLSMAPGTYQIGVFAGERTLTETLTLTPSVSATVTLLSNRDYTAVAVGTGEGAYPLDLRLFQDTLASAGAGQGQVRLIHAAPFTAIPAETNVRVVETTGGTNTVIIPTLTYSNTTGFVALPEGNYNPALFSNLTNLQVLPPQALSLASGDAVTLIAVGDGGNEQVSVIPLPFVARGETRLRLVHAAPFAGGNATASVLLDPDFVADGNIPIVGLNFKGKTLYREVGPGTYTVKVYAGGVITGTPVLTRSLQLFDNAAVTAVVVGKNTPAYPLEIELLTDKTTPAASASAEVRFFHAAPFASSPAETGVDVIGQNDPPGTQALVSNLLYREVSSFLRDPNPPGEYLTVPSGQAIDLRVVRTGTTTDLLEVPPLTFTAQSVQTVIVVGDGMTGAQGTAQPFDLIVLNDLQQTRATYLPLVATEGGQQQ